jgi:putative flippase GtrA
LWLWPNLLSLDAPLIAVLWQGFLAYLFSFPLRPAARLVLGLTVWAIYLLDRLLDARKPPSLDEPARHRYYRRHSKRMLALLALVGACDASIAILWLRPAILRDGLIPLAGVLVYLGAFHLGYQPVKIPKEIAAAILFTVGIFLTAWTSIPAPQLLGPAVAFFLLCLANMVAIEAWEWRELASQSPAIHPITRWLDRTYLLWVPVAVLVCVLEGRSEWYSSIAVSAGACVLLFWMGRRLSLEARRALVDGVLLSPLLFLMWR